MPSSSWLSRLMDPGSGDLLSSRCLSITYAASSDLPLGSRALIPLLPRSPDHHPASLIILPVGYRLMSLLLASPSFFLSFFLFVLSSHEAANALMRLLSSCERGSRGFLEERMLICSQTFLARLEVKPLSSGGKAWERESERKRGTRS